MSEDNTSHQDALPDLSRPTHASDKTPDQSPHGEGDRCSPPPPPPPRQTVSPPANPHHSAPSSPPPTLPPANQKALADQTPSHPTNDRLARPPPLIPTNQATAQAPTPPPPPSTSTNPTTRPPPPVPTVQEPPTLSIPPHHPQGATSAAMSDSPEPEPTLTLCEPCLYEPDTPDNVAREAGLIFRSFVIEQISLDQERHVMPESTPPVHLSEQRPSPLSVESQIGRQLALLGDDINRRYKTQFDQMLAIFNPTDDDAFDNFCKVAHELFRDGCINWGRIVALFFFGYRIAVARILGGSEDFLTLVVRWFVDFLKLERVIQWVADQGGWRVVFFLMYDQFTSLPVISAVATTGACVIFAFFIRWWLNR